MANVYNNYYFNWVLQNFLVCLLTLIQSSASLWRKISHIARRDSAQTIAFNREKLIATNDKKSLWWKTLTIGRRYVSLTFLEGDRMREYYTSEICKLTIHANLGKRPLALCPAYFTVEDFWIRKFSKTFARIYEMKINAGGCAFQAIRFPLIALRPPRALHLWFVEGSRLMRTRVWNDIFFSRRKCRCEANCSWRGLNYLQ